MAFIQNGSTHINTKYSRDLNSEKGDKAVEWLSSFPEESLLFQLISGTVCSRQPILVLHSPETTKERLFEREFISAMASALWVTLNASSCFSFLLPLPPLALGGLNPRTRWLKGRARDSLRYHRALLSTTHQPCPRCLSLLSSESFAIPDLQHLEEECLCFLGCLFQRLVSQASLGMASWVPDVT